MIRDKLEELRNFIKKKKKKKSTRKIHIEHEIFSKPVHLSLKLFSILMLRDPFYDEQLSFNS